MLGPPHRLVQQNAMFPASIASSPDFEPFRRSRKLSDRESPDRRAEHSESIAMFFNKLPSQKTLSMLAAIHGEAVAQVKAGSAFLDRVEFSPIRKFESDHREKVLMIEPT